MDGIAALGILHPVADDDLLHRTIRPGQHVDSLVFDVPIPGGDGLSTGFCRDGLFGGGGSGGIHGVYCAAQSSQGQNCAQGKGHALHNGLFHFT